jgi:hypothetical protein
MAEKLGLLNQWLFGNWAERETINRNAEELATVGADVTALRAVVQRQAQEILQLRAMFMGLVELLHEKTSFEDAELERAVKAAWTALAPPPPQSQPTTDPYRGMPNEPSTEQIAAAKTLLASAQKLHFSKQFQEARTIYQQIVDQYGDTKQATIARQQLENLRKA